MVDLNKQFSLLYVRHPAFAAMDFVEAIQNAVGTMPLSELLSGVHRGTFPGPVDYKQLQEVLTTFDRRMTIRKERIEFVPILDTVPEPAEIAIQAESRDTKQSDCIVCISFVGPTTSSEVLDAILKLSDTLKLVLHHNRITVHKIVQTNHRGGLAHQKRIGKIKAQPRAKPVDVLRKLRRGVAGKSIAACQRRRAPRNWVSRLFPRFG